MRKNEKAVLIEGLRKLSADAAWIADALEGKQQIIDKEYLRGFNGFDSVVCYGISFF